MTEYPKYRRLIKEDGTRAISWNNKLHSWDEPALITPEGKKEYYLYGIEYTKTQWNEFKSDRYGLPWYKNPLFRGVIRY